MNSYFQETIKIHSEKEHNNTNLWDDFCADKKEH